MHVTVTCLSRLLRVSLVEVRPDVEVLTHVIILVFLEELSPQQLYHLVS